MRNRKHKLMLTNIKGCKADEIPKNSLTVLSFKGKKSFFYGYTKRYIFLVLLPVILYALIEVNRVVQTTEFDVGAAIFATLLVTTVFVVRHFFHRRRLNYFKTMRFNNMGKEIILSEEKLFISTGELTRGEVNTQNFFLNGLQDTCLNEGWQYIVIPYDLVKTLSVDGHLLNFEFADDTLEITIGDQSQDSALLKSLTDFLISKIQRPVSEKHSS